MISSVTLLVVFLLVSSGVCCASVVSERTTTTQVLISVRFYGEAECPYCRKFVTETWPSIWSDETLRSYIDYDIIPWGNAYFSTSKCGSGPYDPQQRACWYNMCIVTSSDDEDACFGGDVVYQHGHMEGQVDRFEGCIRELNGLDLAVQFMQCVEGPNMDSPGTTAKSLLQQCAINGIDAAQVEKCEQEQGHKLEIEFAKETPVHPGVPFVVVDGQAMDDPIAGTKPAICESLKSHGVTLDTCKDFEPVQNLRAAVA